MKQILFLLILFGSILNSYGIESIGRDSILTHSENVMQISSAEDEQSLFNGIIPLSPQAAALARYAEYPVNHTTGLPEISIPLYTIKMGGFELPITISYHASGARVNDIPTCVGLGWTLNAGGAITRTIFGTPDFFRYDAESSDYSLWNMEYLEQLHKNNQYNYFWEIIHHNPDFDTESDRYSFNAGGHSGIFRYSHQEKKFYVLNHSSYHISQQGAGNSCNFTLYCPDNTEYLFAEHEGCGVDVLGEGNPYTTAYYVSKITTQWGEIDFSYKTGSDINIITNNCITTVGSFPIQENDYVDLREEIHKDISQTTFTYGQKLIETIKWNGNCIKFNYISDKPGECTERLVSMTITTSEGKQLKCINFNNDDYWQPLSSDESSAFAAQKTGRRMLVSVDDSENGIYSFEYNKNIRLPHYNGIEVAKWSDLWGYYRGERNVYDLTEKVAERLGNFASRQCASVANEYSDRSPVLEATKAGVLKSMTYPTGCTVSYEYSLNSLGNNTFGGLRVSSVRRSDFTGNKYKKYVYRNGVITQEDPEDLMLYNTYLIVYNIAVGNVDLEHLSADPNPNFSALQPNNYISYTQIEEIDSDGSKVVFAYDEYEAAELFGIKGEYYHPTINASSVIDTGNRLPLLTEKTIYDKNGKPVCKETRVYTRSTVKEFNTGIRSIGLLQQITHGYKEVSEINGYLTFERYFQRVRSTARIRAANLKSVTTTDLITGYTETKEYTYDAQLRTMSPRSESITNSDGKVHRTVYEYPFDRTDPICRDLMDNYYLSDIPMSEKTYSGSNLLSTKEFGYEKFHGQYYPISISKSIGNGLLYERERITSYNQIGSPLAIVSEATDTTKLSWDTRGNLLLASTAPGGLTTKYTHIPLYGLATLTLPNGHKTTYSYNSAGMLASKADHLGTICQYSYSIRNHSDASMKTAGNSVTTEILLNNSGTEKRLSRQYHDAVGRPDILAKGGLNTSGTYIYTGIKYDELDREIENWLPVVGSSQPTELTISSFSSLATQTYSDDKAFSRNTYDGLGRIVDSTTPGKAWYNAGKSTKTVYITNGANDVKLYTAPMDEISLVKNGYYSPKTLQGTRTIDEDGKTLTIFTDRLGRKVLERRGTSSDTYFVYNDLGQLRYILSPEYQDAGYKDKYAYEYRYDDFGNMVKEFIPGCGYTQYWYDRSGRLIFMQDETLRARKLHRFYLYDRSGRLCIQGVCTSSDRGNTVNPVTFSGSATGGFQSTGYVCAKSTGFGGVTLECVNYYDSYGFVSAIDSRLRSTGADAKGLITGTVVYNTDGSRIISSSYYDLRGNVSESREIQSGKLRTTKNTYNFTDDILTSTISEDGGLTIKLANGYHAASGLLLTTDMTVNGVTQRVASRKYDSLGRMSQLTRGPNGKAGSIDYTYILNGQLKSISGPAFAQTLYYTDGPGTPCYNGSISSYVWTMGTSSRQRGYTFSYDDINRLTLAKYGENTDLASDPNRYTERVLEYSTNSMIRRFQRHGLKADGVTGKIDNLHVTLDGNRISEVLEDADPVTTPGSMDFAGATGSRSAMTYDAAGNLASDDGRSIISIRYDNSNRPLRTVYGSGSSTDYLYSAAGAKLRTIHTSAIEGVMAAATDGAQPLADPIVISRDTTDYRGNVVYRNGQPDRLLFDGGYVTFSGGITFHYYTSDHLGNHRAVVNGTSGTIEQTLAYYPFGGVIADLGTNLSLQPYKFTGKELDQMYGLNEYDLGSRRYYPSVPTFTQPDPKAGCYPWVSPYAYCLSNPVNNFDPNGEIVETLWDFGNVLYDVGAAIYHHATDNNEAAQSYWTDAAFDLAAAAVPGVPAGTSKLVKAASKTVKTADKASDAVKATKASKTLKSTKKTSTSQGSIEYQRRNAVKEAWKDEKSLVETGKGTRAWTKVEKEELLLNGKVKGYQGHHINSVKDHPGMAGNPENIKFMTRQDHLLEHGGNWKNQTVGPLLDRKSQIELLKIKP